MLLFLFLLSNESDGQLCYEMNLRVVRFKISDDTYEWLVTKLTGDEFDLNELKKMYHMRWDIETAFKVLKYIIGMMSFHSKKHYALASSSLITSIVSIKIHILFS